MIRALTICLALMGLAGCAQLDEPDQTPEREQLWQLSQQALAGYQQWDMHARAAVTLPGEVYNIGLQWRRDAEGLLFLLEAPFGQGVIRIETGAAGFYRLSLPDGRLFLDKSPEALLEQVIGWSIPVSGLDYWIRGMPHPEGEFTRRIDGDGLAREISQDNWSIEYLDYFTDSEPTLPRRLRLAHEELKMRLVIDHWQARSTTEDDQSELFPEFN